MCVMNLSSSESGKRRVGVTVVIMLGVFLVMRSPRTALPPVIPSFSQPQAPPHSYESSHCRALFTVAKEGNSSHLWDLDLKKALDEVPYKRLLWKPGETWCVGGELLAWMENFLKDKEIKTVIRGETSTLNSFHSGVPQRLRPFHIGDGAHYTRKCTLAAMEESFTHLSHQLPTLLQEKKNESASSSSSPSSSFVAYPGTRLHLMRGSVPYIPCQVREYGVEEMDRCVAVRTAKGTSTWITFVGDSNQRQKLHSLFAFLPEDLTYSYYLGNEQVNLYDFIQSVKYHNKRPPTLDIIGRRHNLDHKHHQSPSATTTTTTTTHDDLFSVLINSNTNSNTSDIPISVFSTNTFHQHSKKTLADDNFSKTSKPLLESDLAGSTYDLRVTLVWAPCGSVMDHPTVREGRKVIKLHDLALAKVVPDVVVMGFGTWPLLMREYDDEIVPFSEIDVLFRPLIQTVTALAARTRVIFWSQSRYRGFNYDRDAQPSALPWDEDPYGCWANFLYFNQFEDAIPFVDRWLWEILRKTGAWLWDSALPFNLANLRECQQLREAGYFNHTVYHSRWWNCFDVHHAAYETNSIEIQMLLNLLCNAHLDTSTHYCCST